jgi:hypothetical protein
LDAAEGAPVPAPPETFGTPLVTTFKGPSNKPDARRREMLTDIAVGRWLRPGWVEWLMGAPEGWTDLAPLPAAALERWEVLVASGRWWADEPLPRTIPRQSVARYGHRTRQLGNGQVPLCAAVAFDALRACPLDAAATASAPALRDSTWTEGWTVRRGDLIALDDGGFLTFPRAFSGGVHVEHYCPVQRSWSVYWWPFGVASVLGAGEVTPRHLYGRWAVIAIDVRGIRRRSAPPQLGAPMWGGAR